MVCIHACIHMRVYVRAHVYLYAHMQMPCKLNVCGDSLAKEPAREGEKKERDTVCMCMECMRGCKLGVSHIFTHMSLDTSEPLRTNTRQALNILSTSLTLHRPEPS